MMEIIPVKTERALSLTQIVLADRVLNPYKGCQLGCTYCYARSNQAIKKIKKTWGDYVYPKTDFSVRLKEELSKEIGIRKVLIGSTTEPFQPAEITWRLTRKTLQVLKEKNIPFILLTKSPLVTKCIDVMDYSSENQVYLTVNSPEIRRRFEKRSFPMEYRIEALRKLNEAGIHASAYISPVMPGLTIWKDLLLSLKGAVKKVYFEAYNPKLGNWEEAEKKFPAEYLNAFLEIFKNAENYNSYWKQFMEEVNEEGIKLGLDTECYIYPFDSFYTS